MKYDIVEGMLAMVGGEELNPWESSGRHPQAPPFRHVMNLSCHELVLVQSDFSSSRMLDEIFSQDLAERTRNVGRGKNEAVYLYTANG